MLRHVRPALLLLLCFSLITGLFYPLIVTAIGQALFPSQANGSILERNGQFVGSALIGQQFTSPRYFWSRLSATTPVPYNAASSSGSNFGPLNPALENAIKSRVDLLRSADPGNTRPIPVDLVTASASGLDPHISVASALFQVPRVARERDLGEDRVRALVDRFTEDRPLAVLGEPGVNVVRLNLALDELKEGE